MQALSSVVIALAFIAIFALLAIPWMIRYNKKEPDYKRKWTDPKP